VRRSSGPAADENVTGDPLSIAHQLNFDCCAGRDAAHQRRKIRYAKYRLVVELGQHVDDFDPGIGCRTVQRDKRNEHAFALR